MALAADGAIEVLVDVADGRAHVSYLRCCDNTYDDFTTISYSYKTGSGDRNYFVRVDDISVKSGSDDGDGDNISDEIEEILGYDPDDPGDGPIIAEPDVVYESPGVARTVTYTTPSRFADPLDRCPNHSATFTCEVGAGVVTGDHNPVIEYLLQSEVPSIAMGDDEVFLGAYRVECGMVDGATLLFPFALKSANRSTGRSSVRVRRYDEDASAWEPVEVVSYEDGLCYARLDHFSIFASTAVSNVWHVKWNSACSGAACDGKSWGTAFKTVQEALAAAKSAGGDQEIWVAAGTYRPGDPGERGSAFELPRMNLRKIRLLAGFSANPDNPSERDPVTNVSSYAGAVENTGGHGTINVSACVFFGNKALQGGGGAISSGQFKVINTTFHNNNAPTGGAVCLDFGSSNFSNCLFWDNDAGYNGTHFYICGTATASLNNCDIEDGINPQTFGGSPPIDADPLFVDPVDLDGDDDLYFTTDDGLRVGRSSGCFAAGTPIGAPRTDIIGVGAQRIAPLVVVPDIGAYWLEICTDPNNQIDFVEREDTEFGFDKVRHSTPYYDDRQANHGDHDKVYIALARSEAGNPPRKTDFDLVLDPSLTVTDLGVRVSPGDEGVFRLVDPSSGVLVNSVSLGDRTSYRIELQSMQFIDALYKSGVLEVMCDGVARRELNVEVYKEKVHSSSYYAIRDNASPLTYVNVFDPPKAEAQGTLNGFMSDAVMRVDFANYNNAYHVPFDVNGNGALDNYVWNIDFSPADFELNPEKDILGEALPGLTNTLLNQGFSAYITYAIDEDITPGQDYLILHKECRIHDRAATVDHTWKALGPCEEDGTFEKVSATSMEELSDGRIKLKLRSPVTKTYRKSLQPAAGGGQELSGASFTLTHAPNMGYYLGDGNISMTYALGGGMDQIGIWAHEFGHMFSGHVVPIQGCDNVMAMGNRFHFRPLRLEWGGEIGQWNAVTR